MTLNRLILVMAAGFLCAAAALAVADDESWKGKSVVTTKRDNDIKFSDAVDEKQQVPFNGRMLVTVIADLGDRLLISNGNRLGWAAKADFILDRDAPGYFERRVKTNPRDAFALLMRGVCSIEKGDLKSAIQDFGECIRLDPSDASAFLVRGATWAHLKDYDKAIKDYDEAIRLKPTDASAFEHRGFVWSQKNNHGNAIKDFDAAIRLDPKLVDAFNDRGVAWRRKQNYDKAIKDFEEAIRLDPMKDFPLGNLAWLFATCPEGKYRDGKRAVELATKACELTRWKGANHIDTLAASLAEAGDFEQAVRRQTQAIELLQSQGKEIDNYRRRLELYQKKQPYHQ